MKWLSPLWRRNLVGAIVTAAASSVVIALDLWPPWTAYHRSVVPAHVIAVGQHVEAGGWTFSLGEIRHLNRSPFSFGARLPDGAVLTVVVVDRSGPPADDACTAVITDGERRWEAEGVGGFNPVPAEGMTALCSQPGNLQFAFVLPDDVVPTAVDVIRNDEITVRLLL